MTTRISNLRERVERLPRLKSLEASREMLEQFEEKTRIAADRVTSALRATVLATDIFPDFDRVKLMKAAATASRSAEKLKSMLSESVERLQERSADDALHRLINGAQEARAAVDTEWKRCIQATQEAYGRLIEAATSSRVAAPELAKQLQIIAKQTKAPENETTRTQVLEALAALKQSASDLQLTGEGGRFLVEAQAGRGNPRDLEKPAVREFLDEHRLWGYLKVTLVR